MKIYFTPNISIPHRANKTQVAYPVIKLSHATRGSEELSIKSDKKQPSFFQGEIYRSLPSTHLHTHTHTHLLPPLLPP